MLSPLPLAQILMSSRHPSRNLLLLLLSLLDCGSIEQALLQGELLSKSPPIAKEFVADVGAVLAAAFICWCCAGTGVPAKRSSSRIKYRVCSHKHHDVGFNHKRFHPAGLSYT